MLFFSVLDLSIDPNIQLKPLYRKAFTPSGFLTARIRSPAARNRSDLFRRFRLSKTAASPDRGTGLCDIVTFCRIGRIFLLKVSTFYLYSLSSHLFIRRKMTSKPWYFVNKTTECGGGTANIGRIYHKKT